MYLLDHVYRKMTHLLVPTCAMWGLAASSVLYNCKCNIFFGFGLLIEQKKMKTSPIFFVPWEHVSILNYQLVKEGADQNHWLQPLSDTLSSNTPG